MTFQKILLAMGIATSLTFAEKYEAENATLSGEATKSGNYVQMKGGDITFTVNAPSAGLYDMVIRFSQSYGDKKDQNLVVNNESLGTLTFKSTGSSSSWEDLNTTISLKQGSNTIALTKNWGWIDIDYITIDAQSSEPLSFTISNTLVTSGSTESAQKLYSFLVENFGKKTISGVMTGNMDAYSKGSGATSHEDVQAVYNASGKYPVLVGIDLMNATGGKANDSWNIGYTEKSIDIAKSIWQMGGIPAITWHWRPGSETEFYVPDGKRSSYTNFDFTAAFSWGTTWNENSDTYKALVGDLDKIAVYLQQLQDAGVAAIFRPLHEASGAWFWWGAKGGAAFQALYKLVYDRLVNVKGIKNLVWVWNPEYATDTDWNPGSQYYDAISIDIYNDAFNYGSNYVAFNALAKNMGTNKILALSENGPIPDVTNMINDNAQWSWWMPWYESPSWNGGYVSQTSNSVWQSNMASEYIITLDEMPGWNNVTASSSSQQAVSSSAAASSNSQQAASSSSKKQSSSSQQQSSSSVSSSSIAQSSSSSQQESSSSAKQSSSSSEVQSSSSSQQAVSSSSINIGPSVVEQSSQSTEINPTSSTYGPAPDQNPIYEGDLTPATSSSENAEAIGTLPQISFSATIHGHQLEIAGAHSVNVDIFDMQGRPLFSKKNVAGQISLANLNNGNYILRVRCGSQNFTRRILIK